MLASECPIARLIYQLVSISCESLGRGLVTLHPNTPTSKAFHRLDSRNLRLEHSESDEIQVRDVAGRCGWMA
jgi:hypothetical protein